MTCPRSLHGGWNGIRTCDPPDANHRTEPPRPTIVGLNSPKASKKSCCHWPSYFNNHGISSVLTPVAVFLMYFDFNPYQPLSDAVNINEAITVLQLYFYIDY